MFERSTTIALLGGLIWLTTPQQLARAESHACSSQGLECLVAVEQAIVNLFARWFRALGCHGCSSHSGRRTFITNAARKISTVGGSLRDVQMLAGHSALTMTQRYIDSDAAAQQKIVQLV